MITRCHFCDYEKNTPLNLNILAKLSAAMSRDILEDMFLYLPRAFPQGKVTADWSSVKIHMGIKHKDQTYAGIWPLCYFSEDEKAVINGGWWNEPALQD